jgi:mono/diheme cytochrome c family protein
MGLNMLATIRIALLWAGMQILAAAAYGHGDAQPQPVDTAGLDAAGEEWLKENPYRAVKAQFELAITIGSSGFNQNCARCHGLEVISRLPDLRYLEDGKFETSGL